MAFRDTVNRAEIIAGFPRLMRYGLQDVAHWGESVDALVTEIGLHDTELALALRRIRTRRSRELHWHEIHSDDDEPTPPSQPLDDIVRGVDTLRAADGDERGRAIADAVLMLCANPTDRQACARLAASLRGEIQRFATESVVRTLAARAGLPEVDWRELEALATQKPDPDDEDVPIEIDFDTSFARLEKAADPVAAAARLILDWIEETDRQLIRAQILLAGLSAMAAGHSRWIGNKTIAECALGIGEEVLQPLRTAAMNEANAAMNQLMKKQKETWEHKAVDRALAAAASLNPPADAPIKADAPSSGAVIVCPVIGKVDSRTKETVRSYEGMIGRPLPLTSTPDLAGARASLLAEFPHCELPIDQMLRELVGREFIRLPPKLLVGPPGVGKSRFVRRFGEILGVGVFRVDGSGDAGASFGGTERRWYSTEPNRPFMACARFGTANPLVLVDEVDKAPTRSDYGRLWDAMLQFLEPETAGRFMDPCLQVEMDLSHVSIIATANDVKRMPSPLLDRFSAIVEIPAPGREHLVPLSRHLAADIARSRGWDERFVPPFDGAELAVMAKAWGGGSVRRLRRIAETVVRGREKAERQILN